MNNLPENIIESQILYYLRSKGIFCWKQPSAGFFDTKLKRFRKHASPYVIGGISDILGILSDGRFLAIEVKSKTGRPTKEQLTFIENINKRGGVAFVARSIQEVDEKLCSMI